LVGAKYEDYTFNVNGARATFITTAFGKANPVSTVVANGVAAASEATLLKAHVDKKVEGMLLKTE